MAQESGVTKSLTILLISILLTSCASGVQKMRKLNPGMTTTEVDEIMGPRDSFRTVENNGDEYTLYQYTNQFCNAHVDMRDKCDFFVILKNGKLVETGVRDVRSQMPNMQFIYLFNY
jgi:hypothetical protein